MTSRATVSISSATSTLSEGTAVFGFPSSFDTAINQQWTFIPQGEDFIIANGLNESLFLSYPAAQFDGSPDQAGTAVFSKFPAVFSLQVITPSSPAVFIVEVTHQQALTSWHSVPGVNGAPVTLANIGPALQAQQTWTVVPAA
ncbi:hypothetical protein C8F04DRAFT_1393831 [Mycena alexandri]|nr:hypothetical protein C8F04DRAFT_1393831 [Mycena alexandri]